MKAYSDNNGVLSHYSYVACPNKQPIIEFKQ